MNFIRQKLNFLAFLTFLDVGYFSADEPLFIITFKSNENEQHAIKQELNQLTSHKILTFGKTVIAIVNRDVKNSIYASVNLAQHIHAEEKDIIFTIDNSDISSCITQEYFDDDIWYLNRINQRDRLAFNQTDFQYHYSLHDNGKGVYVYVLDTGIYSDHTEFQGRDIPTYVANDDDGTDLDLHGHGTFVAAIVGGITYGVAKDVNIVSVKTMSQSGSGRLSDILEAFDYVLNDTSERDQPMTSIINMSFGVKADSPLFEEAIKELYNNGIVMVTSAGNNFEGSCFYIPGEYEEVINVGATTKMDTAALFSNWGGCVDILAPGVDMRSAGIANDTDSVIDSGTSYSAPLVAGTIARYLSHPDKSGITTPEEAHDLLLNDATSGKIWIPENVTPNLLLYVNCTSTSDPTTPPPPPAANAGLIAGVTILVCSVIAIGVGMAIYFVKVQKAK